MYTNIQGFTGKKTSLQHIMSMLNTDIVLLAETMVQKPKMENCQSIIPKKSVGQNVAIILNDKCSSCKKMKLYDPNETINMIGVRLEMNFGGLRVYTAHLKQQSTNNKDEITAQFDEIICQFRSADYGRESMLMIMDANVHVGSAGISNCNDRQDWAGKILLEMLKDEGLILLNDQNMCKGVVTRVDPRNGTDSTY